MTRRGLFKSLIGCLALGLLWMKPRTTPTTVTFYPAIEDDNLIPVITHYAPSLDDQGEPIHITEVSWAQTTYDGIRHTTSYHPHEVSLIANSRKT